jgi:hypothetical protein
VILYQLSVFLHLLSAMIWIGGMLLLALAVVPTTRAVPPAERAALFGAVGRRFRAIGWACIGVLIVTGAINSVCRGVTWENVLTAALWGSPFGTSLALKLGVVAVMLGLSASHDFVIGPRSVRILEQVLPDEGGRPEAEAGKAASAAIGAAFKEAERLRKPASAIGRLTAILALVDLALAGMLVRGVPSTF